MTSAFVAGLLLLATPALAQLDQPLPPPPERTEPTPAPKLTKPPAVVKPVEPDYPPEALAAGLSGDVTLTIDIDASGQVTAVVVAQGAGHGFDEAAVAAARAMEFSPAEVDGKPSPIRIGYTVHFKPKLVPTPPPAEPASPEPPPPEAPPPPAAPLPVTVRGRARERGTREPLVGADVSVILRGAAPDGSDLPAAVVGTTDGGGRFELRARAPGGARVIVSDIGHDPCVRDFSAAELTAPAPVDWTCTARSRSAGQYEARVRGKPEHPEETKQTLTNAELSTVPGTANDPLRVIQDLPGVARTPYGLGFLIVRGTSPAETGVFVGGEPIPLLYHFLAGPSVFSAYLIDKIDFYPGGFGVRYGRFAGGAVDVTLKTDVGRTLHGAADINLRDSSAYAEGPLSDTWRASFAVRRSYIDAILPFVIKPKIGSTFVTFAPVYWDYQGRVDHDLARGHLAIVTYGSSDSLHVLAQDPTRELTSDTHIGFHHLMGEWTTGFAGWSSRLTATYGYGDQSVDSGSAISGFQRYHRLYVREEVSKPVARSLTLTAGLDAILSYDWAHYQVELPREGRTLGLTERSPTDIARSLEDTAPAVYVEAQWQPTVAPPARAGPALRLLPRRRHRQDVTRSEAGRAIRGDPAVRHQGKRRHLSRAADAGVPRPAARQSEPEAPLVGPVPAGVRAALHGGRRSDRHRLLPAPPRPAGGQRRSLLQPRPRARLRRGDPASSPDHPALLRLDRLHAVALARIGDAGREHPDGDHGDGAQRVRPHLPPGAIRSAAQPGAGGELPFRQLGDRPHLPIHVGDADHADHRFASTTPTSAATRGKSAPPPPRATPPSASSTRASSDASRSRPGPSASTWTCKTCSTATTRKERSTTIATGESAPLRGLPILPILGVRGRF